MRLRDLRLLQALVESHRLTHRDLAKVAGYRSHTYAGRLLRGEAETVELTPAARIAAHFNVPLADLFMSAATDNPGRADQTTGATA